MALNKTTTRLLLGIGLGAGGVMLAPFVVPVAAAVLRPLVKSLLKQGFLAFETNRERLAVALEGLEDIVAEVKSEVDLELAKRAPVDAQSAPSEIAPSSGNGSSA